MRTRGIVPLSLFLLSLATGCVSFSNSFDSSGSISDVLSSPFESLSGSSGGTDSAYLGDVETLVLAYLASPAAPESFVRALGDVAREHGISDWEADRRTLASVGAGLRRGGAGPDDVDAFVSRYLSELPQAGQQVREGFSARPAA